MILQILQEFDKSWTLKKDGEPVVSHKSFKECDEARDRIRGVGKEPNHPSESMTFSRNELPILDDAIETALMVCQNTLDELYQELSKKELSSVRCRVLELQTLRKRLAIGGDRAINADHIQNYFLPQKRLTAQKHLKEDTARNAGYWQGYLDALSTVENEIRNQTKLEMDRA